MNLDRTRSRAPWYNAILVIVVLGCLFVAWKTWHAAPIVAWLGIGAVACMLYGTFIEPRWFAVRRYREPLVPHPRAWIKLIFLSDLHAGGSHDRSWYERLALEVQALEPDLLVLGGDFVVDEAKPVADLVPLAKLTATLGKYFVLGNHDYMEDPATVRRTIAGWGYTDATNTHFPVTKEERTLQLSMLDDPWRGVPDGSVQRPRRDVPHITISHEPDAILDIEEGDTDLMLAGHTHGGQIRLPFIGAMVLPCIIGRKGDRGRRLMNGARLIVSAGCGETDMRARFLCRPEIVVVEVGV